MQRLITDQKICFHHSETTADEKTVQSLLVNNKLISLSITHFEKHRCYTPLWRSPIIVLLFL